MAAGEIAEFEMRRLWEELAAMEVKAHELCETLETRVHRLQEENGEQREWLTTMKNKLQEVGVLLNQSADRFTNEVDVLARWLEHEHAQQDEVEGRLGRALLDHRAQVEILGEVYC